MTIDPITNNYIIITILINIITIITFIRMSILK